VTYKGVSTKVLGVEHLIAILLRAGRKKDWTRVGILLDQADVDREYLENILQRHNLWEKWILFKKEEK